MNVFYIKLIAIITMVIDHTGHILLPHIWLLREIGRIAFPLFAFLIANGAIHTKDISKYLFRLGLLAVISEPFFSMMVPLGGTNIFFTLFLALTPIYVFKITSKDIKVFLFVIAVIIASYLAYLINSDYSYIGVLFIISLYLVINYKILASLCVVVFMFWLYGNTFLFYYSLISLIPILLYNGKLGFNNKYLQYGFYFFYPIHIFILILLREVL